MHLYGAPAPPTQCSCCVSLPYTRCSQLQIHSSCTSKHSAPAAYHCLRGIWCQCLFTLPLHLQEIRCSCTSKHSTPAAYHCLRGIRYHIFIHVALAPPVWNTVLPHSQHSAPNSKPIPPAPPHLRVLLTACSHRQHPFGNSHPWSIIFWTQTLTGTLRE